MDGRIFHVSRLLTEMPQQNWTILKMAKTVELSAPHFQKLFRTQTGTTPWNYLRAARLDKARRLLESTFHSVKEVRAEVGLSDDSHFTRDFKGRFGTSPTVYRRTYWEQIQGETKTDN